MSTNLAKNKESVSGMKTCENLIETDKNEGENANDFLVWNMNKS